MPLNGGRTLTDTSSRVFSSRANAGWKHYVRLAANAFATMLDLGLFAFAAALIGLAAAIALITVGIVDVEIDLSTGPLLVSSLVLIVVGCFAAGIASEGPIRRNRKIVGNSELEIAIARAVSAVVVGLLFLLAARQLQPLVDDVPSPLNMGIGLLELAGRVGLWIMPLIGVPLALGVKLTELLGKAVEETELPVLFVVWIVGMMFLL